MDTETTTPAHTPTPWTTDDKKIYAGPKTAGRPHGIEVIAVLNLGGLAPCGGDAAANAQLIVTAVNSYSTLKKENERLLQMAEDLQNKYAETSGQAIRLLSENDSKVKRIQDFERAILYAMSIEGIWMPRGPVSPAFEGEAQALASMRDKFKSLLSTK